MEDLISNVPMDELLDKLFVDEVPTELCVDTPLPCISAIVGYSELGKPLSVFNEISLPHIASIVGYNELGDPIGALLGSAIELGVGAPPLRFSPPIAGYSELGDPLSVLANTAVATGLYVESSLPRIAPIVGYSELGDPLALGAYMADAIELCVDAQSLRIFAIAGYSELGDPFPADTKPCVESSLRRIASIVGYSELGDPLSVAHTAATTDEELCVDQLVALLDKPVIAEVLLTELCVDTSSPRISAIVGYIELGDTLGADYMAAVGVFMTATELYIDAPSLCTFTIVVYNKLGDQPAVAYMLVATELPRVDAISSLRISTIVGYNELGDLIATARVSAIVGYTEFGDPLEVVLAYMAATDLGANALSTRMSAIAGYSELGDPFAMHYAVVGTEHLLVLRRCETVYSESDLLQREGRCSSISFHGGGTSRRVMSVVE